MNKILLFLIALLLFLAGIHWFIPDILVYRNLRYGKYGLFLAEICVLILMLGNGTLIHTRYYIFIKIAITVMLMGWVMKVLHLTGADEALLIAPPVAILLYVIHFLLKKEKTYLDILKLLTVVMFFVLPAAVTLRMLPGDTARILSDMFHGLCWTTFLCFLIEARRQKILFQH